MHITDPIWKKRCPFETGTYTPCPPVRRTGKGSAADPKAPTLQDATRGPWSTPPCKTLPEDPGAPHLASRTPRMPRLPPVPTGKQPAEDAEAPTGGPGRLPATGDAKVPLDASGSMGDIGRQGVLGDLGHPGVLGRLGVDGERRRPRGRWGASGSAGHRGVPGYRGVLGVLGCPWCPWTPRCRRGASGASKPIIAKTVFGACLKITDS